MPVSNLSKLLNQCSAAELKAIRLSVERGQPYGGDAWSRATADHLAVPSTYRPRAAGPRNTIARHENWTRALHMP